MKLQILQEGLAKAVSTASRFASPKAQLPILGNILISTQKTKVVVMSTNLEISVAVSVGAKVEEEGDLSIPAKILNDIVSNLPKDTISLSSDKEQLKVSTSGFSSTVLGMSSVDFPKVPSQIKQEKSLALPKKEFVEALGQVTFSASLDETRPVLTGVLVIRTKNKISLVATDGFRLSQKTIKVDGENDFRLILPKMILTELSRDAASGDSVLFDFDSNDKQAVFGIGDTVLTSRLLEGDYPEFEKIIPKTYVVKLYLDKEEFLRSVKLASVFARDAANIVKIKVLKDSIKIFAESGSSGNQEASVEAKVEKQDGFESGFEISFNYRFLEDFLHSVNGEEISLEFSGVSTAGVFRDTSDPEYLHLIMPVRVQG